MNRIRTFLAISAAVCVCCNIFYPDVAVEAPVDTGDPDPFNFSSILDSTREKFAAENYQGFFHERFTYRGQDGRDFFRDAMFERLAEIQREFSESNNYGRFLVTWYLDDKETNLESFDEKSENIIYRNYHFQQDSLTANDSVVTRVWEGKARFTIVYHTFLNTWSIIEWKDESDGSIFNPFY